MNADILTVGQPVGVKYPQRALQAKTGMGGLGGTNKTKNPTQNKDWRKTVSQNKELKPKFRSFTESPKSPLDLSS